MTFSEAQHQAAIDKIHSGLQVLTAKIGEVQPAAERALHWYTPPDVRVAVRWIAKHVTDLAKRVWHIMVDLLKGAAAPVALFFYAYKWESVRGVATGVSGELEPAVLHAGQHWKGTAADAYAGVIEPQGKAAARVGTIADKTSFALTFCAAAGMIFYIALGIILFKFIVEMEAVIAAIASAEFAWAGLLGAFSAAGVTAGLIAGAVISLTAALTAQAQQLAVLHGEAVDNNTFPGGHWPDPVSDSYSDATVTDGDADWSFAH